MCELDQLSDMGGVSRRGFNTIGALAAFAAASAPINAAVAADGLAEGMVKFPAPGGTMDAFFVHPAKGKHPGVVMWPDIASLRDAFKAMARKLAGAGYSVIVPNPFYQDAPAPQFADFDAFRKDDGFKKVGPWMAHNTPEAIANMSKAVVAWLDKQPSVDTKKGIGVQGYCMSGTWTVRTAAAVPGPRQGRRRVPPGQRLGRRRPGHAAQAVRAKPGEPPPLRWPRTTTSRNRRSRTRSKEPRRRRSPPGDGRGLPRRPRLDGGGFAGLQQGRGRARVEQPAGALFENDLRPKKGGPIGGRLETCSGRRVVKSRDLGPSHPSGARTTITTGWLRRRCRTWLRRRYYRIVPIPGDYSNQ